MPQTKCVNPGSGNAKLVSGRGEVAFGNVRGFLFTPDYRSVYDYISVGDVLTLVKIQWAEDTEKMGNYGIGLDVVRSKVRIISMETRMNIDRRLKTKFYETPVWEFEPIEEGDKS